MGELAALGYRDRDTPVDLRPVPVGDLDRDVPVNTVLSRLAAGRSAWNAADVRGEVEQLIAAQGVVVDAGVRIELAEDLTARTLARCVPLLDRDGGPGAMPEHIRALTSQPVLDVEADLTARLAARGAGPGASVSLTAQPPLSLAAGRSAWNLADIRGEVEQLIAAAGIVADPAVRIELAEDLTARALACCVPLLSRNGVPEHVRAWTPVRPPRSPPLAGDRRLMVVEGAAGAGKTSTLAAARDLLQRQGRRLVVVTPTL